MSRTEKAFLFVLMLGLFVPMAKLQIEKSYMRQGDQAFILQLTENIASGKAPGSQVHAANRYYIMESKLLTANAEQVCKASLAPKKEPESFYFKYHANFILYLLAPLNWIVPIHILLPAAKIFSFLGLLLISYLMLRRNGVSILGAGLFTAMLTAHPAWSQGLIGQFYIDRLALFLCLLYLYFAFDKKLNTPWLLISASMAVLISERVGIILGTYTVGIVIMFWKSFADRRAILIWVGIWALIYGFGTLELIIENVSYQRFLPTSLEDLIYNRLGRERFRDNLYVFLAFNVVLMGVFAIFDWRLFLLALGIMLPNMIGNIGGAEKIGWPTHYHSIYFPFLVCAALMGFSALYRRFRRNALQRRALYVVVIAVGFAMSGLDPYGFKNKAYTTDRIRQNNSIARSFDELPWYLGDSGRWRSDIYRQITETIPEGSSVTMAEGGMPLLYKNRKIHYFPIGLDVADYALLSVTLKDNKIVEINSATSFLGADTKKRINGCLFERMKRIGYDFDNAVMIPPFSTAIIKRIPH